MLSSQLSAQFTRRVIHMDKDHRLYGVPLEELCVRDALTGQFCYIRIPRYRRSLHNSSDSLQNNGEHESSGNAFDLQRVEDAS